MRIIFCWERTVISWELLYQRYELENWLEARRRMRINIPLFYCNQDNVISLKIHILLSKRNFIFIKRRFYCPLIVDQSVICLLKDVLTLCRECLRF